MCCIYQIIYRNNETISHNNEITCCTHDHEIISQNNEVFSRYNKINGSNFEKVCCLNEIPSRYNDTLSRITETIVS